MKYLFMSVVILLSVAVCIIIWKKPDTNFYERTIMTFTVLGVMANLFVVINIYYQTDAISQQTNAVEKGINLQTSVAELENRPFLHAVIRPVIGSGSGAETGKWFGPAELDMKNTGRTPATIIGKPEFKVGYDQVHEVDLEGWFKKEYGDFPHVTAVFPGQTSIPISLHPDLGSSPKIAYVWSKIIYTGAASRKKYWHTLKYIYRINTKNILRVKDPNGNVIMLPETVLIRADEDWDGNENRDAPHFEEINWNYYLTIYDEHVKH